MPCERKNVEPMAAMTALEADLEIPIQFNSRSKDHVLMF